MFNGKIGPISERAQRHVPKSPQFYAEMPYTLEVDDHTVRTRDNALMMSLEIQGIDGITASDRDILDLAKSFAAIMDGLDDRFTFYVHRLMRPAAFGLKPIYGDRFAHDVDAVEIAEGGVLEDEVLGVGVFGDGLEQGHALGECRRSDVTVQSVKRGVVERLQHPQPGEQEGS